MTIKTRAEGGYEPPWIESVEIALWFTALLAGLGAALLFLLRPAWVSPLVVALGAVLVLFVLTFIQPPIWLRLALDLVLWMGVVRVWRLPKTTAPIYPQSRAWGAQPL